MQTFMEHEHKPHDMDFKTGLQDSTRKIVFVVTNESVYDHFIVQQFAYGCRVKESQFTLFFRDKKICNSLPSLLRDVCLKKKLKNYY